MKNVKVTYIKVFFRSRKQKKANKAVTKVKIGITDNESDIMIH